MISPVISIPANASLGEAARRLQQHSVGALVVTDAQDKAVGMLTDRDLCIRAVAHGSHPEQVQVEAVMSSRLFSIPEGASPEQAVDQMRSLGIRRIPVLADGKAVDLLALDDVLVQLSARYADFAQCLRGAPNTREANPLAELEDTIQGLRQRAAGAAWRVEASLFDHLEELRQRLRTAMGADADQ